MADLFTKTGEYFMAYDENNEEQIISFKHKANDAIFDDGKDMETKMEELFQYGNDFKQSVADAIIAKGGSASVNMNKDELCKAITNLDSICIRSNIHDYSASKSLGYDNYSATFAELFPEFVDEIDFKKSIVFTGIIEANWNYGTYIAYCPFCLFNDRINNFYVQCCHNIKSKPDSNYNYKTTENMTRMVSSQSIDKNTNFNFLINNSDSKTTSINVLTWTIMYIKKTI